MAHNTQLLKISFISAFLICFASYSFAHSGGKCSRAFVAQSQPLWPDFPKRPYDVLKYQLTLDWRNLFVTKTPQFTGVNIITLKLTQQTGVVELDAAYMQIDSIRVNGIAIQPTPQPTTDEKLTIPLPQALQSLGQQLTITIGYNRNSDKDTGMYVYPAGTRAGQNTFTPEDIAYTMSEPTDAHYWMPCMDQPNDKALSEISIIVPNGIETASNGDLISKEAYTATSTIWHWKNDTPIATYLMVADASNFIHWSQTHERSKMPGDTVHLDYYAWPADYYQDSIKDGSTYNAQYFLSRNTSQIMTWFEARYGGFPFEKYGQVPVQPFIWGGMEHQTCTSINRGWLRGADEGIAHEMSHQWFGDKTTCETFKDIWLNEGFATFSEAVWAESWGGNEWYENIIYEKAADYFYGPDPHNIPIYDPPADNIFNGALTYAKGGLVLHMLRRMLNNDTMFFGALRDYSNAFAYTTANTLQLRDFLGTRLNMDLTEYFDQWIFGRLHPEYQVTWAQNINNRFFLRINQVQSTSIRDHFTMPVKFFAYHGNTIDTLTFTNNSRTQGFQQMLSYAIDSLVFDDDALILSTHTVKKNPALAVGSENTTPSVFDVYIIDGGKLLCKIHETKFLNATIELYNSVGVKIYDKEIQTGETSATIHLRNLASGIYFARYMNGSENFVRSINYVR